MYPPESWAELYIARCPIFASIAALHEMVPSGPAGLFHGGGLFVSTGLQTEAAAYRADTRRLLVRTRLRIMRNRGVARPSVPRGWIAVNGNGKSTRGEIMNKHVSGIIAGGPIAMALPAHAERDERHFEGRGFTAATGSRRHVSPPSFRAYNPPPPWPPSVQ